MTPPQRLTWRDIGTHPSFSLARPAPSSGLRTRRLGSVRPWPPAGSCRAGWPGGSTPSSSMDRQRACGPPYSQIRAARGPGATRAPLGSTYESGWWRVLVAEAVEGCSGGCETSLITSHGERREGTVVTPAPSFRPVLSARSFRITAAQRRSHHLLRAPVCGFRTLCCGPEPPRVGSGKGQRKLRT